MPVSTGVSNRSKVAEKKEPLFLNLEQHKAKLKHEAHEKHKKDNPNEKQKTMLEIYKEIGAVNGPGWRPAPERKPL